MALSQPAHLFPADALVPRGNANTPTQPPSHQPHAVPMHAERETGRSRGFGFVTMNAEEATNAASQLNNTDFM